MYTVRISLCKQTNLTYTRSEKYWLLARSHVRKRFLPTHRVVSTSGKPHKDMPLSHFGALKLDAVKSSQEFLKVMCFSRQVYFHDI